MQSHHTQQFCSHALPKFRSELSGLKEASNHVTDRSSVASLADCSAISSTSPTKVTNV